MVLIEGIPFLYLFQIIFFLNIGFNFFKLLYNKKYLRKDVFFLRNTLIKK